MGGQFSGNQSFGPEHDFVHQHSSNMKIMTQWKESNTLPKYFPDEKDGNPNSGMTALMAQAQRSSDDVDTLTFLLDNKADPNLQALNNGNTALHFAITSGDHSQKVLLLLQRGANPTIKNSWGKTPLELAKFYKRNQCIATLSDFANATS
jgi:ankyrin repeat protein